MTKIVKIVINIIVKQNNIEMHRKHIKAVIKRD